MLDPLNGLRERDGNLRMVMKEFPILSPVSVTAAKAALAAGMQGRYAEFHVALMAHRGRLDEGVIFGMAEKLGLDEDWLKSDMESAAVRSEEHTSELQSLMRISYAVFLLKNNIVIHNDAHEKSNVCCTDTHTSHS